MLTTVNVFRVSRFALTSCRGIHSASSSAQSEFQAARSTLLAGRTCLITNCDSSHKDDFPSQIAYSLAKYGANVLVHGVRESHVSPLLSHLPVLHPKQKHGFIVSEMDNAAKGCENIAQGVRALTPSLEVVVHNTGIIHPSAVDPASFNIDEFDGIVRLNLTTPFALVQKLLPVLLKSNNPSVILSSPEVEAEPAESADSPYYVSKFGFRSSGMLTKMLAAELGKKNIRVNTVDAGRVLPSNLEKELPEGEGDKTAAYVWLARPDTIMNGEQVDVKNWLRRDPVLYKSYY